MPPGMRLRPYSCRRRVRRRPFPSPSVMRGDGAPSGASLSIHALRRGHPWRRVRAVRRSIAAFYRHRAALSDVPFRPASGSKAPAPFGWRHLSSLGQALRPAVSQLLAGDPSVPGRSPGAARGLGGCVHPPPAGAASDPTCMTPHESALGGPNARIINAPERGRISSHDIVIIVLGPVFS